MSNSVPWSSGVRVSQDLAHLEVDKQARVLRSDVPNLHHFRTGAGLLQLRNLQPALHFVLALAHLLVLAPLPLLSLLVILRTTQIMLLMSLVHTSETPYEQIHA